MPTKTTVSVLAELERYGITYLPEADNRVKCKCPFHDDQSPSCSFDLTTGYFQCRASGCGEKGWIHKYLARWLTVEPNIVWVELSQRYDLEQETKTIKPQVIERFFNRIYESGPLLQALRERVITDQDIRQYRLGFDGTRITIPIFNGRGDIVNIRRYLPGAPGAEKMKNEKGFSRKRLYPYEQLQYDNIVIAGGEIKAIAGARVLNPHGIGVVCVTGAEGAWDQGFTPLFAEKRVTLCFDIDEGGRNATNKVGAALVSVAKEVRDCRLPLDIGSFPTGDINDFLRESGPEAFVGVILNAKAWQPIIRYGTRLDETEEPVNVELSQAVKADYAGKRVRFKAVVSAMHESPYPVPKSLKVICSRDENYCALCPVKHQPPDTVYNVQNEHPALLRMVGSGEAHQREALKLAIGVPPQCKVAEFKPQDYHNAEDVKVSPELEITSRATERTMQSAIVIGADIEMNESYEMEGRMFPHPSTQQATLVVSKFTPTQDALGAFKADDESLKALSVFQPSEWSIEGIQHKLNSLYNDLTANVTRVFQRDQMHLVIDLIFHSPLLLPFDGRNVKGWAEGLIIGDSSQGKSAAIQELQAHYKLGVTVDCKNASVAGLHGGLAQIAGKWYVTWGVIPTHDRRLVILEEVKGASEEVLAKLTDMRSRGRAEIYKIEKRATLARTRLLCVSNPRSDMPMRSYNYGVEAVKELMGSLEDVRRFDIVLAVGSTEIDPTELNKLTALRPEVPHVHTAELCRSLVLWAWTRGTDNIRFDPDAEREVFEVAIRLSSKYVDDIPIVDRGSQRLKIARLAAALACRTFSHADNDTSVIRIRKCHVLYIEKFLDEIYSNPVLGYSEYSNAVKEQSQVARPGEIKAHLQALQSSRDFVRHCLNANTIDLTDVMDWGNLQREVAQDLLSVLVRTNSICRRGRFYRKTPDFTRILRELLDAPEPDNKPPFQLPGTEY